MSLAAMTQVFLAVVFAVSAVTKLADHKAFEQVLSELLSSRRLIQAGTWVIPIAELLGGMLLLVSGWELPGQVVLLGLIAGFGWSHWAVLSRRKNVACHCFGSLLSDTFGWRSATRVLVLLMLVVYLVIAGDTGLHERPLLDWAATALTSVGILLIYALVNAGSSTPSQFNTQDEVK